jgi:gas vesicle protein
MADEDLGIKFKDKSNDDDLGIKFKDESSSGDLEPTGTLGKILNVFAPGVGSLEDIVAKNPQIIKPGLKTIAESAPKAAAQSLAGISSLAGPVSTLFNAAAESVPTPSQRTSDALSLAASVVPGVKALENIGDLAKLGTLGSKKALQAIQGKLGNAVEQKSNNFIDNLLHGKSIYESTEPVAQEVRNKYAGIQQGFGKEYDTLKNNASSRGYSPIVSKQYPGISVANDEKSINTPNFKNDLSKLDVSKYSPEIKESIDNFNENPSFSSAHDLQSTLGREGSSLKTNKDGAIRNLGNQLLNARKSLVNDIHSTFENNGDKDLSQLYRDIGQRYKNKSAPYVANSTLRNIVLKKDIQEINPTTIGNLLKKNDAATKIIRGDLSPQSKDLLLANEMKGAVKETPHLDGSISREVDPQKLIDLYSSADNKGISYLRNPDYNKNIASLISDLKKQKNISRIKSGLKWGTGLGAGALGLNEVRKYL